MARLVLSLLLLLAPPGVRAAETVSVRLGSHDGFGRVVFEFPAAATFSLTRTEGGAALRFTGAGSVPDGKGSARNVLAVSGGADSATISVTPGSRLKVTQLGGRVVVDVLDPAAPPPPKTPQRPAPLPAVALPAGVFFMPAQSRPPPAPALAAPPPPAAPVSLAAAQPPAAPSGTALIPFGAETGAAAFRRGSEGWVVFDQQSPIDLAWLQSDPAFAGAAIHLLPSATLMRVPLPPGGGIALSRQASGWLVAVSAAPPAVQPLSPAASQARLLLPVTAAARATGLVVAVADPGTGQNLLVATLRGTPAEDHPQGVPIAYRTPEFTLLPSWRGAVVEPLSDHVVFRAVPEGFAIETGLPFSVPATIQVLEDGKALTRRFDFPGEPAANLLNRLQIQVQGEGDAPPQARLAPRKAAAQTMLALGLAPEAQALLRLAVQEDPRAASDPDMAGLAAVAAILAGRLGEADGLLSDSLTGTDEIALWRAVRAASLQESSAEAAPLFAATIGLVLSYPTALRTRLLPLAAETMAQGGASDAADALLAKLPDEPLLGFARAMRLEAKGDPAGALALYDLLAASHDRLASARASYRAVLLRQETGAIGPAEAADRVERGLMAWRGDARERDARLQAAELRGKAGQWRPAFGLLRDTLPLFPDDGPLIRQRTARMFDALFSGAAAAAIPPLDLVVLAEENAELVAQADPAVMGVLLADKLVALDLPRRADPVLQRMVTASAPGEGRAALGARLAAMRLATGDLDGAAAALATTAAPDIPAALAESRGLLDARIHAAGHDAAGAAAILARLGSDAALDMRATILAQSGEWRAAAASLATLAARTVPPDGALSAAQQDLILRLASATSHEGDAGALRALNTQLADRMAGPKADMFRLLTAAPVNATGDLKRAAGEITLARAIPAAIAGMGSQPSAPRGP